MSLNEFIVEGAALEWFVDLSYTIGHSPHMATGEPAIDNIFGISPRILEASSPNLDLSSPNSSSSPYDFRATIP